MTPPAATASHRLVILGASNVARGIGTIVQAARELFDGPVEVLAAMGHGRSYGKTSSIPLRSLPSILNCGLWPALAQRPVLPTSTLITDVGNDLAYGFEPPQIIQWVEECAARLQPISQQIAFTALPLASVSAVGSVRFLTFRQVLFPKSKLQLVDAKRFAQVLDQEVRRLAQEKQAALIEPSPHWYGVDPIHIRLSVQREAWRSILSALCAKNFSSTKSLRASWREWLHVMSIRPERSEVLRRAREVMQPAVRLADGSSVSFY